MDEIREKVERRLHQDHCSMWTADGGPCLACKAKARDILDLARQLAAPRGDVASLLRLIRSGYVEEAGQMARTMAFLANSDPS